MAASFVSHLSLHGGSPAYTSRRYPPLSTRIITPSLTLLPTTQTRLLFGYDHLLRQKGLVQIPVIKSTSAEAPPASLDEEQKRNPMITGFLFCTCFLSNLLLCFLNESVYTYFPFPLATGYTTGLRKGLPSIFEKKKRPHEKLVYYVRDEEMKVRCMEMESEHREKMAELEKREVEREARYREKEELIEARMKWLEEMEAKLLKEKTSTSLCASFKEIKVPTPCSLLVPYGPRVVCAEGNVYPIGKDVVVHSLPLLKGFVKVSILHVSTKHQLCPLPQPVGEMFTLRDAHKSFVQWPCDKVKLVKGKQKIQKNSTRIKKKIKIPKEMSNCSNILKALYVNIMSREDPTDTFQVFVDSRIFEDNHSEFYIPHYAIYLLMIDGWLHITIIEWFTVMLHLSFVAKESNKCAFISPSAIIYSECVKFPQDVISKVVKAIQLHKSKTIFLAPYIQGAHCVLFVICPYNNTGYILDSRKRTHTPKSYYVTPLLEKVVAIICGKPHTFIWNMANCNQQDSNWECGYYVMNWMYHFVNEQQFDLPDFPICSPWNSVDPFSRKDINAIRDIWASKFKKEHFG